MADFDKLNDEELKALFSIDPSAAPVNPWNPKFSDTPKGKSIRMQFEARHPVLAAGLKSRAPGFNLSARAEMYNRGLIPLDREVHEELMHCDPLYRQQKEANQKAEEERILAEWDKKADELAAQRGFDWQSKLHAGNLDPKFAKYWRDLQAQQILDSQS